MGPTTASTETSDPLDEAKATFGGSGMLTAVRYRGSGLNMIEASTSVDDTELT
jgi:hypothetical protein